IIVPTFVKCRENFAEMESWYDQWLRALGTAVITGPSDCAGQIPSMDVANMTPPKRKPCARLDRRMMVLADGRMVSCEQDVFGRQVLGEVGRDPIMQVWNKSMATMRNDHHSGNLQRYPLCVSCGEWHRP
ncbi:MAG TPA: SPASM domain-containing protein, partial [Tepidisphaeraceae bacterium]|nr:SPASM domain-containing protein [Tepidisphaeraceae bacterium]